MKTDRILLLTGTAPGSAGVGGIILADLVRMAGVERFACAWLAPRRSTAVPATTNLAVSRIERRYETAFRPLRGIVGELISAGTMRVLRPSMLRNCVRQVRAVIDRTQPDCLLAVLESPAAIQVAARIQRQLGIPMLSIVWDDVDLFCRQASFDRWTSQWVRRDFADVLRHSQRVAVICENMQRAYRERYGIDSMVVRHGLPPCEGAHAVGGSKDADNRFLIGFAGSVTAPDCLQTLVQALDAMNWKLGSRDIVLRMLGARYLLDSQRPQRIEYLGWRNVEETRMFLAECDLLYLPQTFHPEMRFFSELSFPTKLSTYVAARKPIFLHAPEYASLHGFWAKHEMGPVCDTLDVSRTGLALQMGLDSLPADRAAYVHQIEQVHRHELSSDQFDKVIGYLLEGGNESNSLPVTSAELVTAR